MKAIYYTLLPLLIGSLSSCSWFGLAGVDKNIPTFPYTIKAGDTLYEIGRYYGFSADYLEDLNDVDDPRELTIGTVLRIPLSSTKKNSATTNKPARPPEVHKENVPDHKASSTSQKTVKLTLARAYIGKLIWPVRKGKLTSYFGNRWLNFHEGIDISAPTGSPILAAHDGLVVYSDNTLKGYGNVVVLKGNGLLSVYGHCHRNLVRAGKYVKKGSIIAEVGSTGKSSGPHLHFETRVKNSSGQNVAVDPLVFYP